MKRAIACLFFLAFEAAAQRRPFFAQQYVTLKGQVVEAGSSTPIAGAEVTVAAQLNFGSAAFIPRPIRFQLRTDFNGRFNTSIPTPSECDVEVRHANFGPAGPQMDGYSTAEHLSLQRGQQPDEIRIEMAQTCALSGRVVDRETRQPLAGFAVLAAARSRRTGFDSEIPVDRATANANGRFRITGLPPAPYRIRFDAPAGERSVIQPGTVDLDEEKPASGYCELWWPGADRRDQSAIQMLASGQEIELGDVSADRCPTFTVAVHTLAVGCAPGAQMDVLFERVNGERRAGATLECGSDFFIRGAGPGDYNIYAEVRSSRVNPHLLGQTRLTVVGPARTELAVSRGVRVCGRVTASGGVDLKDVQVDIRALPDRQKEKSPVLLDAEGNFCDDTVPLAPLRLRLLGLPAGAYLRDIDYNGGRISSYWTVNPAAPHHTLLLDVAPGLARLEGKVSDGEKPQPQMRVFLVPWPATPDEIQHELRWTISSATGGYSFSDVEPGGYRVLAAPPDAAAYWLMVELPSRFQSAHAVQIASGETRTFNLTVSEP